MTDVTDNTKLVTDDLVGKELKVPTLYEQLGVRTYVSMLSVHRGATYFSTVGPNSLSDLFEHLVRGTMKNRDPERSLSASLDRASIVKMNEVIEEHGIPDLQVVYLPGIDIFTHAAEDPLNSQVRYLEHVTDGAVGQVLDEYRKHNALDNTYVIFIADHAHIPTLNDEQHRLGPDDDSSPFQAVARAGFRVRKASLILDDIDKDFQAVLAYQGSMAFIYLANRTTCPKDDDKCDWNKPPRFEEDVIPVLKSLYRSNQDGRPVAALKGKLDLIFSRQPTPSGTNALPFEVFDGGDLVPIDDYLSKHHRPDLPQLAERMRWLSAGRYGNRAGDILLLPKACMNVPIENRYYCLDDSLLMAWKRMRTGWSYPLHTGASEWIGPENAHDHEQIRWSVAVRKRDDTARSVDLSEVTAEVRATRERSQGIQIAVSRQGHSANRYRLCRYARDRCAGL